MPLVDDDPATVKADRRAIARALAEVDSDPATVRRSRTPLSFLGESTSDPVTVFDDGADPSRWRDDIDPHPHGYDDELPPGPLPSAVPDRSGPTLVREIPLPGFGLARSAEGMLRHREEPSESRVTFWLPVLVGAGGGLLLLLLVTAFLLGSP